MRRNKMMVFAMIIALLMSTGNLTAKSRGGGSRSKSSFSSSKSKSSWGSSKSTTAKKSTWGTTTSKTAVTKPTTTKGTWGTTQSKTDAGKKATVNNTKEPTSTQAKSVYSAPKKKAQSFKNKESATASFKKNSAGKYKATYKTEPKTRPTHIPQTYSTGGTSYNINYNSTYGGYGYMNSLGTWIMYDMMLDNTMMNRMMVNDGYAYPGTVGYRRTSSVGMVVFLTLLISGIIGTCIYIVIKRI